MDANTKDVLMAIIALISAVVTPLILLYVTKKQNEKIDNNQVALTANQTQIAAKVEEYHKEVNGHMTQLLKTREDLGAANEKVRAAAEAPTTPTTSIHDTGPVKLTITEGELKVIPETKPKPKKL